MPELNPTRSPELMSRDRADLDALLSSTVVGNIAFVLDGEPAVIPTAVARWGDRLLAHGSTGSRWMRAVATGIPVAVPITAVDGIVVARSTFESSLLYRSAVLFGAFTPVEGEEKEEALGVLSDRILPGRSAELRRSNTRELAATMLLAMPIDSWSLRIFDDWPDDEDADIQGPAWAGQLRFGPPPAEATEAPDLRPGIPIPDSVGLVSGVR